MKYYGELGFIDYVEDSDGNWSPQWTRKYYAGDLTKNTRQLVAGMSIADDISINNTISIICDPYAESHFQNLRYATLCGNKFKITNVEVMYPRLLLSLGGLYNEPNEPD